MQQKIDVLDKGFVRLVDVLPSNIPAGYTADYAVVEAARVSYKGGLKTPEEDKRLLNYLYEHKHFSCFEMASIKFHIKAPIFIARQWMRHRNGAFNEISGRYVELKDEFYSPTKETIKQQSTKNKQGTGEKVLDSLADKFLEILGKLRINFSDYQTLVSQNLSREQARIILPVSTYTEFYWYVSLRSLLNFIDLRDSPHAQGEMQEYGKAVKTIANQVFPWTMEAYEKQKNIVSFTKEELSKLNISIKDGTSMSERQLSELKEKLK